MSSTVDWLKELFMDEDCIELNGKCQKCGENVKLILFKEDIDNEDIDNIEGNGGVAYKSIAPQFKCDKCLKEDNYMINPQTCEVYSRVVGYLSPTLRWNKGKKAEFLNRKTYDTERMVKNNDDVIPPKTSPH